MRICQNRRKDRPAAQDHPLTGSSGLLYDGAYMARGTGQEASGHAEDSLPLLPSDPSPLTPSLNQ